MFLKKLDGSMGSNYIILTRVGGRQSDGGVPGAGGGPVAVHPLVHDLFQLSPPC